jgi:AcrR family transcriptional regulator
MPRAVPPDRLAKLIDAAAATFVELGYQRTQMDDIAARLGVAKGTIYRSVESKEALFAAVLDWGDRSDSLPGSTIATSSLDQLGERIGQRLSTAVGGLALTSAIAMPPPANRRDLGRQIEQITTDLHHSMTRHRTALMVLDRCAAEIPELTSTWYLTGRYAIVDLWTDYLASRGPQLSPGHRAVLARSIVELITTWAVKISWDPAPRPYPIDTAPDCARMTRHLILGATR